MKLLFSLVILVFFVGCTQPTKVIKEVKFIDPIYPKINIYKKIDPINIKIKSLKFKDVNGSIKKLVLKNPNDYKLIKKIYLKEIFTYIVALKNQNKKYREEINLYNKFVEEKSTNTTSKQE